MVKLRLKRIGKKQSPFYRIVAADSRVNRNGQYIELVGTVDPLKNEIKVNKELVLKWLNNGAQPTDTVKNIFSSQGIMTEFHNSKQTIKNKDAVKKTTVKKDAVKKTAAKKTTSASAKTK